MDKPSEQVPPSNCASLYSGVCTPSCMKRICARVEYNYSATHRQRLTRLHSRSTAQRKARNLVPRQLALQKNMSECMHGASCETEPAVCSQAGSSLQCGDDMQSYQHQTGSREYLAQTILPTLQDSLVQLVKQMELERVKVTLGPRPPSLVRVPPPLPQPQQRNTSTSQQPPAQHCEALPPSTLNARSLHLGAIGRRAFTCLEAGSPSVPTPGWPTIS